MSFSNLTRTLPLAAVAVWIAAFALPARAADRLTPGQYELIVTSDGQTRKLGRCVTAEDARSANAGAKAGRQELEKLAQGTCSVSSYELDGDTLSTTMKCGEATSASRTTYHGDSYSSDTTDTIEEGGKTVVKKRHVEAKRVGDCP